MHVGKHLVPLYSLFVLVEKVEGDILQDAWDRRPSAEGDAACARHDLRNSDFLAVHANIPVRVRLALFLVQEFELAEGNGHAALEAGVELHEIVPVLEERLLEHPLWRSAGLILLGDKRSRAGGVARRVIVRVLTARLQVNPGIAGHLRWGACLLALRALPVAGGLAGVVGKDHALHDAALPLARELLRLGDHGLHRGVLEKPVQVDHELELLLVQRPMCVRVHRRQSLEYEHSAYEVLPGEVLPPGKQVVHVGHQLSVDVFLSYPSVEQPELLARVLRALGDVRHRLELQGDHFDEGEHLVVLTQAFGRPTDQALQPLLFELGLL
mmetsp:Transcript_95417/g.274821  ORF Transcript_95417/g.274821 Transcript_95417/m.274821 type:complete len:326 (+) Transcript_95417:687-1664(+)